MKGNLKYNIFLCRFMYQRKASVENKGCAALIFQSVPISRIAFTQQGTHFHENGIHFSENDLHFQEKGTHFQEKAPIFTKKVTKNPPISAARPVTHYRVVPPDESMVTTFYS